LGKQHYILQKNTLLIFMESMVRMYVTFALLFLTWTGLVCLYFWYQLLERKVI